MTAAEGRVRDQAVEKLGGHKPAGPLRGGKYSAFDAGTRVPFIVRWPGHVKRGVSDALVCQIDFLASFAALTGQRSTAEQAHNSPDVLPALIGPSTSGRDHLVGQAAALSIIVGQWKYIEPHQGQKVGQGTGIELGNDPEPQLYDLANDIGETRNGAREHPDRVEALAARLEQIRRAPGVRPSGVSCTPSEPPSPGAQRAG